MKVLTQRGSNWYVMGISDKREHVSRTVRWQRCVPFSVKCLTWFPRVHKELNDKVLHKGNGLILHVSTFVWTTRRSVACTAIGDDTVDGSS